MGEVVIDELPFGFSWYFREPLTRAGHALDTANGVWLVDPVDVPEALERAAALGPALGVLQLLDRHNRDCAAIAARLGVPHLRVPREVPGSPFTVVPVIDLPGWREVALWWPEHRALVVAELIGTNGLFAVGRGPAGLHPLTRLLTPRSLLGYEPEHLLVGHGPGVHGPAAAAALEQAHRRSRRDLPKLAARLASLLRDRAVPARA